MTGCTKLPGYSLRYMKAIRLHLDQHRHIGFTKELPVPTWRNNTAQNTPGIPEGHHSQLNSHTKHLHHTTLIQKHMLKPAFISNPANALTEIILVTFDHFH